MQLIAYRQLCVGRSMYAAGELFTVDEYRGKQLVREGKAYDAAIQAKPLTSGLVSCIMPTRDRRAWIPRALECWQSQTYKNLHLIVIDNGAETIKDLLPSDQRITYIRAGAGLKIGMLRNMACQLSTGEYIAHWDDDDWYAPERIERQMEKIGGAAICAFTSCLFDERSAGVVRRYQAPTGHAIGSSFLYRRDWWQSHRFSGDIHVGEDSLFFHHAKHSAALMTGDELLVASIHQHNTSPRTAKNQWKIGGELPKGYEWPSGL